MAKLENVADPEQKRKIIGGEFIRVFEEEARKLEGIEFLGQGTIYPDIIESGTKTAKMVKSHHNVGGLPEDLQFELVEPLNSYLRTRFVPAVWNLDFHMIWFTVSHSQDRDLAFAALAQLQETVWRLFESLMQFLREEFAKAGLDKKVWQYFTVVPDFKSVGVKTMQDASSTSYHPCSQYY